MHPPTHLLHRHLPLLAEPRRMKILEWLQEEGSARVRDLSKAGIPVVQAVGVVANRTTPEGEALRDDEHFAYVAAWEYAGDKAAPVLNKEPLDFEYVHLAQRSYK